jgi:hypothetical protein
VLAPRSQRLPDTWRVPSPKFEIVSWQWFWHSRHVSSLVSRLKPSSSSSASACDFSPICQLR